MSIKAILVRLENEPIKIDLNEEFWGLALYDGIIYPNGKEIQIRLGFTHLEMARARDIEEYLEMLKHHVNDRIDLIQELKKEAQK